MKLSEIYPPYEKSLIDNLFNQILDRFNSQKKAPYVDKELNPKEDEFLELININYSSEYINVYCRFENPEKWAITFLELRNAIKLTIRHGQIMGAGNYNKMTGTSNFVGTPLHILIALIPEDEYKKKSLVGKLLKHSKFGLVEVDSLDLKDDFINIKVEEDVKKTKMDFWEIDEKEFRDIFDESAA